MKIHRLSLFLLYSLTIAAVVYLIWQGFSYYALPLTERPHHLLHPNWKPGGFLGHGLGIVGTLMMLILLLYSLRKRTRAFQRLGNIRYWLNYHIWLGITGPVLVTFHSSFKFGGIVAISFWSMVAVALSGVLGRYIYLQIPRTLTGEELTEADLQRQVMERNTSMRQHDGVDDEVIAYIDNLESSLSSGEGAGWKSVFTWFVQDIKRPVALRKLHRYLQKEKKINHSAAIDLVGLVRQNIITQRRIAFLETARELLHHWHIIHKPFAIVMLVIMCVHVVVAILFGYRWIF